MVQYSIFANLYVISFSFYLLSEDVFIFLGAVPIRSPAVCMPTKCHWKDCKNMFKEKLNLEDYTFVSRYSFGKLVK
ncbi:Uncharacterized protein APZ42_021295 [Daphnia magna]|uniref:Uncharacterized protein n=1 Tax=Daphnia magna TaxID=35525 RepID=A0A164WT36_9CRUS|nr:Uncharacterized protein APZ42_021295 [Daphnia magna]